MLRNHRCVSADWWLKTFFVADRCEGALSGSCHRRRSHPVVPMRRVPSNFGDHGDQVYLVPSNLQLAVVISLGTAGSLQCSPDFLAKF